MWIDANLCGLTLIYSGNADNAVKANSFIMRIPHFARQ